MSESGSSLLVDWDSTADLLAWAMLSNRFDLVDSWFRNNQQTAPVFAWDPEEAELGDERMRESHRLWWAQPRVNGLPDASVLDHWVATPPSDDVTILASVDGGRDFTHRLFARSVSQVIGNDWTGKPLSTIAARTVVGIFFMGLYRAIMANRRSVLIVYAAEIGPKPSCWRRYLTPFANPADGAISALVSCNQHLPLQRFDEPLRSLRPGS